MERDEIVTLPNGTEISIEAAQGDLARTREYLSYQYEQSDCMDEMANGLVADVERVSEFLGTFTGGESVSRDDVVKAIRAAWIAGHGDSNDDEIAKLQHALGLLINYTGFGWPSMPEQYTTYVDSSHPDEPTITVEEIDADDEVVELDNGQWYSLYGPDGFFAKLDAGIIRRA